MGEIDSWGDPLLGKIHGWEESMDQQGGCLGQGRGLWGATPGTPVSLEKTG